MKTSNLIPQACAVGMLVWGAVQPRAEVAIPNEFKTGGYAIGCQAWTFNNFTAFEAIEMTAAAGGKVIEFFPGQKLSKELPDAKLEHGMPDDLLAKVQAKLAQHAVRAVNYGVVGIPNDEAGARKVFEFAKRLGLRGVTTEAGPDAMDLIEKLAKEYDILVGLHNHPKQPNNPNYKHWDPQFILGLVKHRDARLGAALDTGHIVRSGIKPVEAMRILKGRVVSCHMKDLHEFTPDGHDMPFGTGVGDIKGQLDELAAQGFQGNISIEYEYNWGKSLPEVAQCIGFVRGYGAGKAN